MELRDLSKMQIRAEVMMLLQQLYAHDELPKDLQDKCLASMKSIKNTEQVLEVLLKEFVRVNYDKGQILVNLLTELGTLAQLKKPLWSFIKDTKMSDTVKDLAGIVLRNLGDDSDPGEFLSYLDNPKEVIDKETKKILEMAVVNPEAQIDFLDFLFALPEQEQITLVESLKEDYPGEFLANILITALDTQPSEKLEEAIIVALGETRSELSVPVLTKLVESGRNEIARKMAKKSLNMLKIAGIDTTNFFGDKRGFPICQLTKVHECYSSVIDGAGSQGIIFSRIKENRDVLMFSVVISDLDGIVGCFGFNGISEDDFGRIVLRFHEESTRVSVSPEYCKYLLEKAEKINENAGNPIPYEYIAWKSLLWDIPELDQSVEKEAIKWASPENFMQGEVLYKHPDFKHWFLDDTDHPAVKEILDKIILDTLDNKQHYRKNSNDYIELLENKVTEMIVRVFDENWRQIYKSRLLNAAYLLDCQGLEHFKEIASSVAAGLSSEYNMPLEKSPFIRQMFRKTIIEGFLRYQHNLEQQNKSAKLISSGIKKVREFNNILKTDTPKHDLNDIIDILYNTWQYN
ncbi:MAG: hypothetical protein ACD_20C00363G0009 [uncultured bacterium]|nr:MAG: hypothetical protein ACD_20C00363G0009 [uncultured bacterium]HBH18309.1 hypothetical protein [Cyanobacteria bacterium UBA9579]